MRKSSDDCRYSMPNCVKHIYSKFFKLTSIFAQKNNEKFSENYIGFLNKNHMATFKTDSAQDFYLEILNKYNSSKMFDITKISLAYKMLHKSILQLKKTEDLLKKHKNKAKFTINSKKY